MNAITFCYSKRPYFKELEFTMKKQLQESIELAKPLLGQGHVATYIPELSKVEPKQFSAAIICHSSLETFEFGEKDKLFSIQSVSKLFSLTLALNELDDKLWLRTNKEPSGMAFNSLVQLEYEQGIPRNPFINAGAIVTTDILCEKYGKDAFDKILSFIRNLAGNDSINFDESIYQSEKTTGHRNYALAYFMKSYNNIHCDVDLVLDTYFKMCSIMMSSTDLARAFYFLCNGGLDIKGNIVTNSRHTKRINALMMSCGTYDNVGEVAYRIGLPCKSGVGGAIVAALANNYSICVWSPALNEKGNSLFGMKVLEEFTTLTGKSSF